MKTIMFSLQFKFLVELTSSRVIYPMIGRIIGGENTTVESHPYQVSVRRYGRHICGGSIISENYVLTAAHCLLEDTEYMSVRAAATFHYKGGSIHKMKSFVLHENFKSYYTGTPKELFENDIAVIRVDPPFEFDDTRLPIELSKDGEFAKVGAAAVVTGWGLADGFFPAQLQKVTIPIVGKYTCNKAYKKFNGGIMEGQICAGTIGKDACIGDSGGPLAIDNRLFGIVSWGGASCADPEYPGVYTEISYQLNWIRNKTGNL